MDHGGSGVTFGIITLGSVPLGASGFWTAEPGVAAAVAPEVGTEVETEAGTTAAPEIGPDVGAEGEAPATACPPAGGSAAGAGTGRDAGKSGKPRSAISPARGSSALPVSPGLPGAVGGMAVDSAASSAAAAALAPAAAPSTLPAPGPDSGTPDAGILGGKDVVPAAWASLTGPGRCSDSGGRPARSVPGLAASAPEGTDLDAAWGASSAVRGHTGAPV